MSTLDAYAHQDAPFEAVLEAIHPERAPDRTPVFQVMLNLANFAGPRVHRVDRGGAGVLGAKFDLPCMRASDRKGSACSWSTTPTSSTPRGWPPCWRSS